MPHEQDDTRTPDDPQRNVSGERPVRAAAVTDANRTRTGAASGAPADAPATASLLSPHAQSSLRKRQADERVLSSSQALIAQTRQLDSRLNVAAQTDRQLARRAAGLVTQLARRLSVLLSRTSSLLPVLPGHGNRRVSHYVVHAERSLAGSETSGPVRMLTIGSNGMLRVGNTDSDASGIVWAEYDPFAPAAGWELEVVIERLTAVVVRIEGHVDAVESRVQERSRALDSLTAATARKAAAASPPPVSRNPISPLLSMSHSAGRVPSSTPAATPPSRATRVEAASGSISGERDGTMDTATPSTTPSAPSTLDELHAALEAEMAIEMEEAMEQDLDQAMAGAGNDIFPAPRDQNSLRSDEPSVPSVSATEPQPEPAPAPGSLEDAQARYERSRHKRQLFDRLR